MLLPVCEKLQLLWKKSFNPGMAVNGMGGVASPPSYSHRHAELHLEGAAVAWVELGDEGGDR